MALFGFGKKKGDDDANGKPEATPAPGVDGGNGDAPDAPTATTTSPEPAPDGGAGGDGGEAQPVHKDMPARSLRKRDKFLDFARDTAEKHQWDYSLEMYASALRHDPGNTSIHEEMYDAAKKRLAAGGGRLKKVKAGSKFATDQFLAAIHLAATNITDGTPMIEAAEKGAKAVAVDPDGEVGEAVHFWGEKGLQLELGKSDKKTVALLGKAMTWFEETECYDLAVKCCRKVITQNGSTDKLMAKLKELEAGEYSQKNTSTQQGGFRENVKDSEKQRELDMQDRAVKSEQMKQKVLDGARTAFEEDPLDPDRLQRYVKALLGTGDDDQRAEAVELLEAAYERDGTYKVKAQADDIRMRQFKHNVTELQKQVAGGNDALKPALEAMAAERAEFELGVFQERAKKYPTNMRLRYDVGTRLYALKRHDDAIAAFQQATADAKVRANAFYYLGLCFVHEGLVNEAISMFDQGIAAHPLPDDQLGLDIRYHRMDALEQLARDNRDVDRAKLAREQSSEILTKAIGFRDIKDRAAALKQLVEELTTDGAG